MNLPCIAFHPRKNQVCLLNCLSCLLVPPLSVPTGTLTVTRGTRPRKRSLSRPEVCFTIFTFRSMDHVTITHEATFVPTVSGKMKTLYAVIITTHGHIYLEWHVRMLTEDRGPCLLHMLLRIWTPLSLCCHAITPLIRMMILSLPLFTILHGTHLSVYNESERQHLHALFVPCLRRSMTTGGHTWAKGSVCIFVSLKNNLSRVVFETPQISNQTLVMSCTKVIKPSALICGKVLVLRL